MIHQYNFADDTQSAQYNFADDTRAQYNFAYDTHSQYNFANDTVHCTHGQYNFADDTRRARYQDSGSCIHIEIKTWESYVFSPHGNSC